VWKIMEDIGAFVGLILFLMFMIWLPIWAANENSKCPHCDKDKDED